MSTLENNHKNELCSAIRTSGYSKKVVTLLRDMSDNLYKTDSQNLMTSMENSMDDDLLDVFKDILEGVETDKPMDAEARLRQVIDYIKEVDEISFIIPIHPNKDFVKRLFDWCSENIKQEILMDFTVNRLMESGVLMIYKGRYFEYSLENLLDEYFKAHDMDEFIKLPKAEPKDAEPQAEKVGTIAQGGGQNGE